MSWVPAEKKTKNDLSGARRWPMRRSPSTPSRNWVMHQFTDGFHHEKGRNNAMKNAVLCKVKASCESCVWIIENGETCCVVNVKPCETIKSGGENHRQWQVSRQKMMVLPSKIMVLPLKMNVYHHFFLRAQIVVLQSQMVVWPSKCWSHHQKQWQWF